MDSKPSSLAPRSPGSAPLSRSALVADAGAIATVHVQSWQGAYPAFMPQDFLDSLSVAEREATWRKAIERGHPKVLVVELAGRIAGFCALGHCRDATAGPDDFELWAMYLAPSSWSQGLGRALWLEALRCFESVGAQHVSLWVIAGNTRATRFYERMGFRPDAVAINPVQVAGVTVPHQRYHAPVAQLRASAAAPSLRHSGG